MRVIRLIAPLVAATMIGCAGSHFVPPPPPPPTLVPLKLTVNWPARTKDINPTASTLSVRVTLIGGGPDGANFVFSFDRDDDISAHTVNLVSDVNHFAAVGTHEMVMDFCTQRGGLGTIIATVDTDVTVAADGTGIPSVSPVSSITQVLVDANQEYSANSVVDLKFRALDADGNIVAVSRGSASWSLLAADDADLKAGGTGPVISDLSADGRATLANTINGPWFATVQLEVDDVFSDPGTIRIDSVP